MAYDEDLAERVRELIGGDPAVTEKKMFGGLAFLVGGSMAVGAGSQGGLMVRVDPASIGALLKRSGASQMEMRGRPMKGWVLVDAERLRTKRQLAPWVQRGMDFARSLPPKK
ncbi:MAG: TfoX/Sxy family protein [Acidimicrobiales bacterium]